MQTIIFSVDGNMQRQDEEFPEDDILKYHRLEAGGFPERRMNSTIIPLPLRERPHRSCSPAGRVRGHNLAKAFLPPSPLPSPVYAPQGEGVACPSDFENLSFV